MAPLPSAVDPRLSYLDDAWEMTHRLSEEPTTARLIDMPALVYSPGKTGTRSLRDALQVWFGERGTTPAVVLHKHDDGMMRRMLADGAGRPIEVPAGVSVVADLIAYRRAVGIPIDVVTSFRDPVERTVSRLYQKIWVDAREHGESAFDDWTVDRCAAHVASLLRHARNRSHPAEEVVPDLFDAHAFDHDRESCLVEGEGFRLLVLRLEGAASWTGALERDLGYAGISVTNRNPTTAKSVAPHREATRGEIRVDARLLRHVYGGEHPLGRQLRWFYTESELRAMRRRALEQYAA